MPVAHIYTGEGWLTPARKKLMIEKVTQAIVETEGIPAVRDLTYVLIHDVRDGGWGYAGVAAPAHPLPRSRARRHRGTLRGAAPRRSRRAAHHLR